VGIVGRAQYPARVNLRSATEVALGPLKLRSVVHTGLTGTSALESKPAQQPSFRASKSSTNSGCRLLLEQCYLLRAYCLPH
jgi:hypothetical protein